MTRLREPRGALRVNGKLGGSHPADGLTATVHLGDGAQMSIVNPQSLKDGGPEWHCRYGNVEGIRYAVASLLESYDYLLSDEITTGEAVERLRTLRRARSTLASGRPLPDTAPSEGPVVAGNGHTAAQPSPEGAGSKA